MRYDTITDGFWIICQRCGATSATGDVEVGHPNDRCTKVMWRGTVTAHFCGVSEDQHTLEAVQAAIARRVNGCAESVVRTEMSNVDHEFESTVEEVRQTIHCLTCGTVAEECV